MPTVVVDERFDLLTAHPAWCRLGGVPDDLPSARRNLLAALADAASSRTVPCCVACSPTPATGAAELLFAQVPAAAGPLDRLVASQGR